MARSNAQGRKGKQKKKEKASEGTEGGGESSHQEQQSRTFPKKQDGGRPKFKKDPEEQKAKRKAAKKSQPEEVKAKKKAKQQRRKEAKKLKKIFQKSLGTSSTQEPTADTTESSAPGPEEMEKNEEEEDEPEKKKRRVSFPAGPNIKQTSVDAPSKLPTNKDSKSLKSILKRRNSAPPVNIKDKKTKYEKVTDETEEKKVGNKSKLQVTRKQKEDLKNMTRKERQEFIIKLRQKKKQYFDVTQQCKRLWEVVRNTKTPEAKREKCLEELCSHVRGKAPKLIYAHDTVRVIQCLMALEKPEIRAWLFEELKGEVAKMVKSKYARFFVIKMFKYGTPAQRATLFSSFRGHVVDLFRHNEASEVIEYGYNEFANKKQRFNMVKEFYGPAFSLFETDDDVFSLPEIINKEPAKKEGILNNLKETLNIISQKNSLKYSLAHRLLIEYLDNCTEAETSEMVDTVKERYIEFLHTRDGARAAMYCVWYSNAQDRKMLVRLLKDKVVATCMEEFGHLVMLAMFDSVDDTRLMYKHIIKIIAENVESLIKSKHGMKVLDYLIRPRDPRYFQKDVVQLLAKGDSNSFSKKESAIRAKELWSPLASNLVQYVTANLRNLLFDKRLAMFVLNLLTFNKGEESKLAVQDRLCCYEAFAQIAQDEFIPYNLEEQLHLVEHPQAHFVFSRLIKCDKNLHEADQPTLTSVLIERISKEHLISWTSCNKGCFVLISMLETGVCKEQLMSTLSAAVTKLQNSQNNGAKLLLEKILGEK